MLKLRKNKKGFTLVELIVVIAIMAVLAGTVAGVTVSQLNKQTNSAGVTQARNVCSAIQTEIAGNSDLLDDGKFVSTEVSDFITEQFSGASTTVVVATSAGNDKGTVYIIINETYITSTYVPKGSGNSTSYYVTVEGIINEGTAPAATTNP